MNANAGAIGKDGTRMTTAPARGRDLVGTISSRQTKSPTTHDAQADRHVPPGQQYHVTYTQGAASDADVTLALRRVHEILFSKSESSSQAIDELSVVTGGRRGNGNRNSHPI
jgi:hypothetical protein